MRASVKRFVLSPPARAPAAPSCRGHTGAPQARLDPPPRTALRRRLVPILHPGRPCAAGSSRSSTPDALAPQARLDPPRGWRAGSAWAPALGSHCGLRGRLRHRRAARSEPIVHCRWFHAPRLPVPLARAASSASRVPSAWRPSRPRAAPPPPCTLAHASASSSADRLSWTTPLRRRLVSRRHVARASPARSADFDLRALDPPMAASDGPSSQRPPERVRRCAESELNQQIIPSRPASLSRPKRAAAATLQAIDRSLDEQDRAIPSQYSAGTTQRTALNG